MSTGDRPERKIEPPLVAGQRLDRPTFHERYEAMPPGVRAELIEGIVYMPSPVSYQHMRKNDAAIIVLGHYERFTPGVEMIGSVTTMLDGESEVQPDALLRILPECGGQTYAEGKYLGGAPELVVEVAHSTRATDLGPKLRAYEKAGVREYLVAMSEPDGLHWHVRRGGKFVKVPPGDDGLHRSEVFPGLWLDPQRLLARDLNGLIAMLDQGLASPEHAAFVERLAGSR